MGKIVVLTGGASGIGAAAAKRLIARDHRLYVLDVAAPTLAGAQFIACDLGDVAAIERAIAQLPERIDTLVNVAGIPGQAGDDTAIAVNFLGMRHLVEALLPRVNDGGSVVNVASTAGWDWEKKKEEVFALLDTADFATGRNWLGANADVWRENPYKFSKQCAAAYTYRAAGMALDRRVRVNCVNPGATETQLTPAFKKLVGPALYDWGVAQVGRQGTPEDIAEVIEFLAVGECRWLNGVEIVVDGGYIAGIVGGWVKLVEAPEGGE